MEITLATNQTQSYYVVNNPYCLLPLLRKILIFIFHTCCSRQHSGISNGHKLQAMPSQLQNSFCRVRSRLFAKNML